MSLPWSVTNRNRVSPARRRERAAAKYRSTVTLVAGNSVRPAMDALRYVIDETKSRAPVWKLEHYLDGTREWVNAGSHS